MVALFDAWRGFSWVKEGGGRVGVFGDGECLGREEGRETDSR